MPLLNVNPRFAEAVARGEKRQTIRKPRKRPIRQGDTLYIYTGLRRPGARYLGAATVWKVVPVTLTRANAKLHTTELFDAWHLPGGLQRFAWDHGFLTWTEMIEWCAEVHGLPFEGELIMWGGLDTTPRHRGGRETDP